jgi:hypothetical protein
MIESRLEPSPPGRATGRSTHPVLLVWLLLGAATGLPYAKAALAPPPGAAFTGAFYYTDDFYNYLSYVEQAERGAVLFRNKQVPQPHSAVLLNLEWLLVGRVSALLGRHPVLAYRLLGLLAALAFLWIVDDWLGHAGLPDTHRLPALVLVGTGGGLGGLLYFTGLLPGERALDLRAGLFPFLEVLANPHFVAGTLLLALALRAVALAQPRAAAAWGTVLGLVRPYEVVILGFSWVVAVIGARPRPRWFSQLWPLLLLFPVLAYNAWVFLANPAFGVFSSVAYQMPRLVDFVPALGPAALLGALAVRRSRDETDQTRAARRQLWAWAAAGLVVIVLRPVTFSLQLLVGVGTPLLCLAALGLSARAPALTLAVATALSTTAVTAVALVSSAAAPGYTRPAFLALSGPLRQGCADGDLLFAPAEIGLYAAGLSACRPYVGHAAVQGFAEREAKVHSFYSAAPPQWRAQLLDELGAAHVVLPPGLGHVPEPWLGSGTPFRRLACAGQAPGALCVYSRPPPQSPPPPPGGRRPRS